MVCIYKKFILILFIFIQSVLCWGREICSSLIPEEIIIINPDAPVSNVCYNGENIRLRTTVSTDNQKYEWVKIEDDNTETVVATNTDYIITSENNIGKYELRVYSPNPAEEAVPNGDFEIVSDNRMTIDRDANGDGIPVEYFADNSKKDLLFATDYMYGTNSAGSELYGEGTHRVGTSANDYHSNFCNTSAHSGSKFLIANGAANQTTRVWFKQVQITPNTKYAFSVWGLSVHPTVPAKLAFFVTDDAITTEDIANGAGQIGQEFTFTSDTNSWNEFFVFWDSGAFSGTKILTIVNTNIASSGNDFAIDDVSFCGVNISKNEVAVRMSPSIIGEISENIDVCMGDTSVLEIKATSDVDGYTWTKNSESISKTTQSIEILSEEPGNFSYVGSAVNVCGSSSVTYNLSVHPLIRTGTISHN